MSEIISLERAKEIMGDNCINPLEYSSEYLGVENVNTIPDIPYSETELNDKQGDYYLILGMTKLSDGREVTIRNLREVFGNNPDVNEPCFYNQDWYDKEYFIDIPMKNEWFLIRKNVFEDSRAVQPEELMKKVLFPSAITCTYAFFVVWLCRGEKLWLHDFVWCADTDHNGDKIYVGKYNDVDGVNKNGFSVHRHLSLRPCYGCID